MCNHPEKENIWCPMGRCVFCEYWTEEESAEEQQEQQEEQQEEQE